MKDCTLEEEQTKNTFRALSSALIRLSARRFYRKRFTSEAAGR